ncbi:FtsH protease activity modulator HflK [Candidatus Profftella armatura (Diaphorina cf. continua)]|uniref:Protein HflK n=1 Tax=Candidatus Profftella armatura (Diaphorina cf. continua) TaxID=2661583 RepID=A0A7R6VZX1_9PROT|nr:FtsH protease activity modulator HflK [Candidatus Profftella armatura (Diaphorina cf. continua)]BCG49644.1 FtsH protease activity modulator HflK [Candidatus Profftella armatura (Diaphorina cf. continua)]
MKSISSFIYISVIIFFILLCAYFTTGFFIVQEGQTAVVLTFGKYSYSAISGFNWKWPYPIQNYEIVNISQLRTVEIGYRINIHNKRPEEALMLTDDENIIDIQFAVQYKLKNAADWMFNNIDQENMIRQVAETVIREIVGQNKMDYLLYAGREKVSLDVNKLMQNILNYYKSGVQVVNVTMQGIQPPEQVQAIFDDTIKAGQDCKRLKNEGQMYANDIILRAKSLAYRLIQESEAYKLRVIINAEGETSRFQQILNEYQKSPEITKDRMYLNTMQHIFSNTTKIMLNTHSENNIIYLPIDKLMEKDIYNIHKSNTIKSNKNLDFKNNFSSKINFEKLVNLQSK